VIVTVKGRDMTRALKRFKKEVDRAGILSDLKRHRHSETPAERKRRKRLVAAYRRLTGREGTSGGWLSVG
jgi:small subunit ribosomal protein S21